MLVTVYRAEHLFDAHLRKHTLENAGLRCFVFGDALTGAIGELPAMGYLELKVVESEQARALAVLAELAEQPPLSEDWGDELPVTGSVP